MKSLIIIFLSGLFIASFAQRSVDYTEEGIHEQIKNHEELSQPEINSLKWMREEEMLAHDIYTVFSEKYALPLFRNISNSELRHTTAVAELLDKYDLEDPATDHRRGIFQHPGIQSLYNRLVAKGNQSFEEAILVGLEIEDMDIADLENAIAGDVDNEDIIFVYTNLIRGSSNHLKAFWFHAERNSIPWEPSHISKERFHEILGFH
jgi:hypothetical protein